MQIVSEQILKLQTHFGVDSNYVYVATGLTFADALSGATLAAKNDSTIILVGFVIGGTSAVSEDVAKSLPGVTRLAGEDRFGTNIEVAKHFGVESDYVYVATGLTFADALSGAPLAAKNNSTIILVGHSVPERSVRVHHRNKTSNASQFSAANPQ